MAHSTQHILIPMIPVPTENVIDLLIFDKIECVIILDKERRIECIVPHSS
jgi:hypothetical protein